MLVFVKVWVIILGITFSVIAGAELKSVFIESGDLPKSILDKSSDALAKASHACHIQKHLGAHADYVRQNVFPRVQEELKQVLGPQKSSDGSIYYMGETVDYGDLFHAHVRDPLSLIQYNSEKLDSQFTDNTQYHLQYHTYEYIDYLILNWSTQLKEVDNVELQAWLEKRQEYVDFVAANQEAWSSGVSVKDETGLVALTEEQRSAFAQAWDLHLGDKSPGFRQLEMKVRYVDPKDFKSKIDILSYRSIVSKNDEFRIIRPLNINDHLQSATVYFEEIEDSPLVKAVIDEAKQKGFQYLVNSKSQYFSKAAFPNETRFDEQQALLDKIYEAAQKTTEDNPLYMFGHAFEGKYDQSSHVLLSWSDKYLFSIRYFIPCGDKEKALAETISENQSLGVQAF